MKIAPAVLVNGSCCLEYLLSTRELLHVQDLPAKRTTNPATFKPRISRERRPAPYHEPAVEKERVEGVRHAGHQAESS